MIGHGNGVCLSDGKETKNKDAAPTSSSSSSSVKPKVKRSSSIAGISLCWQGVVQRQVRRFNSRSSFRVCPLESFLSNLSLNLILKLQVQKFLESSCSLPDFVEHYRSLYLRLKTAMEELFGQQTAFVLALRHGFSAALLQLSILRAMHVSRRLNFRECVRHYLSVWCLVDKHPV